MKTQTAISPLIIPLIGTIVGIYLQTHINLSILALCIFVIFGFSALFYGIIIQLQKYIRLGLFFVFLAIGSLLLNLQQDEHQLLTSILKHNTINILGTIYNKETWGDSNTGDALYLTIHEIFIPQKHIHQKIMFNMVCYYTYHSSLHVGDSVLIENIIFKQSPLKPLNTIDFQHYLTKEGIFASIFSTKKQKLYHISRPLWSFNRWLWQTRIRIYESVRNKMSTLSSTYVGLIFMGNKQQSKTHDLRTSFGYWGLSHYLARSGLHIVLFILIWGFLLRLMPLHIHIKTVLLIVVCLLYDITSWSSIPFIRAYYAFLCVSAGQLLSRITCYQHILALICLGIVLHNPMQVLFLDFQLTFGLTFALIFLSEIWSKDKIELIKSPL